MQDTQQSSNEQAVAVDEVSPAREDTPREVPENTPAKDDAKVSGRVESPASAVVPAAPVAAYSAPTAPVKKAMKKAKKMEPVKDERAPEDIALAEALAVQKQEDERVAAARFVVEQRDRDRTYAATWRAILAALFGTEPTSRAAAFDNIVILLDEPGQKLLAECQAAITVELANRQAKGV